MAYRKKYENLQEIGALPTEQRLPLCWQGYEVDLFWFKMIEKSYSQTNRNPRIGLEHLGTPCSVH